MRLPVENIIRMNRVYERRTEEEGMPFTIVDAMWMEHWLGPCADPDCFSQHHWELSSAIVRNDPDEMPKARIFLAEDSDGVQVNLSKPALARYISELKELFEELP